MLEAQVRKIKTFRASENLRRHNRLKHHLREGPIHYRSLAIIASNLRGRALVLMNLHQDYRLRRFTTQRSSKSAANRTNGKLPGQRQQRDDFGGGRQWTVHDLTSLLASFPICSFKLHGRRVWRRNLELHRELRIHQLHCYRRYRCALHTTLRTTTLLLTIPRAMLFNLYHGKYGLVNGGFA